MKTCQGFNKKQLYSLLSFISDLLDSPKYEALNNSNHVDRYKMSNRFDCAYKRLEKLPEDIILSNEKLQPIRIRKSWASFDASFDGTITEDVKKRYGILIKSTASFLKYLESLPELPNDARPSFNARSINVKEEQEKQIQLKKLYDRLKDFIENEQKAANPDKEKIEALQKQLEDLTHEMKDVHEKVESVDADRKAEENWAKRIEDAFKKLSAYTQPIEEEKTKATAEYWLFLITTWALVFSSGIIYYFFIKGIREYAIVLCSWLDYLPYAMMLPLYGLLIWLCVYQKNRAHKIAIELTTRLFNIHYLEGLLKLTNTLSPNPNEAIGKIEHAVDSMLHSYLKQIDRNHLSENELSRIETQELEGSPYWKLLQEIKELIKTIKQ